MLFKVKPITTFTTFTEGKIYPVLEVGRSPSDSIMLLVPDDNDELQNIPAEKFKYVPKNSPSK